MSLEKGVNSKKYYAPMSALQIALIYEDQNNFSKARYYFNSCISMSGFDYQRGIHQKAKAGLNRISN
jgi:predicted negative regulator of RcsB-dependent stress response